MNEVNATPHAELIAELMNPNNPKNDREHAAVREIERLRETRQAAMTDLRQAATLALEALEWVYGGEPLPTKEQEAITALKAALEQPEQELPPEWPLIKNILAEYGLDAISFVAEFKAAQRPWQGLTDNDWGWVADRKGTSLDTFDQGAAWAAARLKERNT
jgi:hypothetical protein